MIEPWLVQRAVTVETDERLETVDITAQIEAVIPEDCSAGICSVYVRHTTAAVIVQENEPRLRSDIETLLADLVPDDGHAHDTLDENADAHLRATLLGREVTVPVTDGALSPGTWGSLLLVECDGPRSRTVTATVTPACDS